jgi:hypothetical protein
LPDYADVERWARVATTCSQQVFAAVDEAASAAFGQMLAKFNVQQVHVVTWEGFSITLNTLVQHALIARQQHWYIQSVDVAAQPSDIACLLSHMDESTLVVGARLAPSHGKHAGACQLAGDTSPWNTCALWKLERVAMLGFQGVSDGIVSGLAGGMEEVAVIALHQKLFPSQSQAKLISLSHHEYAGMGRNANDFEARLASKNERASSQLAALGLFGTVQVIHTGATL